MAVTNLDTLSPLKGRVIIDSNGIRLAAGACTVYRLVVRAKALASGSATLKIYDATSITGTPVMTWVTNKAGAILKVRFPANGHKFANGLLFVSANSGEEFELLDIFAVQP